MHKIEQEIILPGLLVRMGSFFILMFYFVLVILGHKMCFSSRGFLYEFLLRILIQ